ncbi:MAG: GtrA family protein [Opitutaceae bacterium]|nr:GtrA family protein [Opitutaceae bacterium]
MAGWLKFIAIGLGGYLVLTGGVAALVEMADWGKRPAYIVVIAIVMCGNFYANRRFVYPQSKQRKKGSQAARFLFFALLFRLLEYAAYSWLIGPVEMHYVIAITLTSAVGYLIKYYVFSIWVFR